MTQTDGRTDGQSATVTLNAAPNEGPPVYRTIFVTIKVIKIA